MRCYTKQHTAYGGRALPARRLDVCLRSQGGERLLQRPLPTRPALCLTAIAPSRADVVGAGAGLFPWSWLADLCARAAMPCVLGHARAMQALHGGPANNETIAAPQMAVRRRGGLVPQA